MRVVMFLTGDTPFGHAWANAARQVCEVVTIDVASGRVVRALRGTSGNEDPQWVIPRLRLRPKRLLAPVNDGIVARRLVAAIREIDAQLGTVDLLHSHFYPSARHLPAVSRSLELPYVHTEHSTSLTPRAADHKQLSGAGLRSAARTFGSAATVIAVSDYLRRSIVELGLPCEPVVLGNPVDVEAFRPRSIRTDDGTIRLVSVGRLEADKRPLLLLDAFALARRRDERLRLELIGRGPQEEAVRRHAEGLGVQDALRISGQLSSAEVATRVADAHAFVSASQVETFGVAIAEAQAAGTPVVAFAVTAIPEIVDATAGRLVDGAAGADELAAALLDVVSGDEPDRGRLAAAMRKRFAPAAIGERLMDVYHRASRQA